MPINMKMISCKKCGGDMPELRKTQYGYSFCISCSDVKAKRGITIQLGTGEDTWNETIIMEHDTFEKYLEHEKTQNMQLGKKLKKAEKIREEDEIEEFDVSDVDNNEFEL
jgi:ssDNA-binding Zn-finger/Zn-ribbon topoisomerase 1